MRLVLLLLLGACDGPPKPVADTGDPVACPVSTWYTDADADGYGEWRRSSRRLRPRRRGGRRDRLRRRGRGDPPGRPRSTPAWSTRLRDGIVGDVDDDGDGVVACLDCDDTDATAWPGAAESATAPTTTVTARWTTSRWTGSPWYADADGDAAVIGRSAATRVRSPSATSTRSGTALTTQRPAVTRGGRGVRRHRRRLRRRAWTRTTRWTRSPGTTTRRRRRGRPPAPLSYACDPAGHRRRHGRRLRRRRRRGEPRRVETCNGVDDDCDGLTDDDTRGRRRHLVRGRRRRRLRGPGRRTVLDCAMPPGTSRTPADCDDTDATENPGAPSAATVTTTTATARPTRPPRSTSPPGTRTPTGTATATPPSASGPAAARRPRGDADDCDDTDAAVSAGRHARSATVRRRLRRRHRRGRRGRRATWYVDADGDGYGDPGHARRSCAPRRLHRGRHATATTPARASRPVEAELCNTLDDDCDGTVDENDAVDASTWYVDADLDGYGDSTRHHDRLLRARPGTPPTATTATTPTPPTTRRRGDRLHRRGRLQLRRRSGTPTPTATATPPARSATTPTRP